LKKKSFSQSPKEKRWKNRHGKIAITPFHTIGEIAFFGAIFVHRLLCFGKIDIPQRILLQRSDIAIFPIL
jgi:hypothetical protein